MADPSGSATYRPVFNGDVGHGEVVSVRCRYGSSDSSGRRGDQTIGLVQCHTALGELPPPRSRPATFRDAKGSQPQPLKQPLRDRLLSRAQTTPDFFDGNGADPWLHPPAGQTRYPGSGRSSAKRVYEYREPALAVRRPIARVVRTHAAGRRPIRRGPAVCQGCSDVVPAPSSSSQLISSEMKALRRGPRPACRVRRSGRVCKASVFLHGLPEAHNAACDATVLRREPMADPSGSAT